MEYLLIYPGHSEVTTEGQTARVYDSEWGVKTGGIESKENEGGEYEDENEEWGEAEGGDEECGEDEDRDEEWGED